MPTKQLLLRLAWILVFPSDSKHLFCKIQCNSFYGVWSHANSHWKIVHWDIITSTSALSFAFLLRFMIHNFGVILISLCGCALQNVEALNNFCLAFGAQWARSLNVRNLPLVFNAVHLTIPSPSGSRWLLIPQLWGLALILFLIKNPPCRSRCTLMLLNPKWYCMNPQCSSHRLLDVGELSWPRLHCWNCVWTLYWRARIPLIAFPCSQTVLNLSAFCCLAVVCLAAQRQVSVLVA